MLFNSFNFFLFLIPVIIVYWLVPRKSNWLVLFLASNVFVGLVSIESLIILYAVTTISYFGGRFVSYYNSGRQRNLVFYTSLISIIALLSFYKYLPFLSSLLDLLLSPFSIEKINLEVEGLLLPIGISFYVFQAIGYIIAIYRNQIKPERELKYYFTYMFYFPKLLAGPIEKSNNFLPQLHSNNTITLDNVVKGSKLFILGLFKKLVVADRIGIYVDSIYNNYDHHSSSSIIVAAILYVFQIYSDFSGYTDMARGVSKVFGYNLMENFNRPILAQNISGFWRRWHISLTTWATDNIYYPVVVKRRDWGNLGVLYATFFTFLLIGIWHGPTFNFVIFGFIQVLFVYYDFISMKKRKKFRQKFASVIGKKIYRLSSWLITMVFVTFSMIIFRIEGVEDLYAVFVKIFTFGGGLFIGTPSQFIYSIFGALFIFILDIWKEFYDKTFLFQNSRNYLIRQLPYLVLVILILVIGVFDGGQFIYLQF